MARTAAADRIEIPPEIIRQGQLDNQWLEEHPEALDPYRGEWVVVHSRRIVAHFADGREAAREGNADKYPGGTLFYVPTDEEANAIRIV
jgi:hypothetical protein